MTNEWYAACQLNSTEVVCSGKGLCVPGVPPGAAPDPAAGVCECFDGWSGKSDMFNLDGYDCSVNVLAERIVYGLVLAFALVHVKYNVEAARKQYSLFDAHRNRELKRGKVVHWYETKSLIVVAVGAFGLPWTIALSLIKILSIEQRVVGLDPLVSLCMVCGTSSGYSTQGLHDMNVVHMAAKSLNASDDVFAKARRMLVLSFGSLMALYGSLTFSLVFFGVATGVVAPSESSMGICIVVRSGVLIVCSILAVIIQRTVERKMRELLHQMNSGKPCTEADEATKAVDTLAKSAKAKAKALCVIIILYTTFALPRYWHLSSFVVATAFIVSYVSKSNYVQAYRYRPHKSNRSEKHLDHAVTGTTTDLSQTCKSNAVAPAPN